MVGGGVMFLICPSVGACVHGYGDAGDGILRPACRRTLRFASACAVTLSHRGSTVKLIGQDRGYV